MLNIKIRNCNNIDYGNIKIKKNTLNIKHGINGTGKSTISKAMEYYITNKNKLKSLQPFKHITNTDIKPEIDGLEEVKSIKIFNDTYIINLFF